MRGGASKASPVFTGTLHHSQHHLSSASSRISSSIRSSEVQTLLSLNHPETVPQPPSMETLSSMKPVPDTKKVGTAALTNTTRVLIKRGNLGTEASMCEHEGGDWGDISLNQGKSKVASRTSLMTQWIRICLPMQGTWVQSLVGEDSTRHRATKPFGHNYLTL